MNSFWLLRGSRLERAKGVGNKSVTLLGSIKTMRGGDEWLRFIHSYLLSHPEGHLDLLLARSEP